MMGVVAFQSLLWKMLMNGSLIMYCNPNQRRLPPKLRERTVLIDDAGQLVLSEHVDPDAHGLIFAFPPAD
jgi:hypothetical protein